MLLRGTAGGCTEERERDYEVDLGVGSSRFCCSLGNRARDESRCRLGILLDDPAHQRPPSVGRRSYGAVRGAAVVSDSRLRRHEPRGGGRERPSRPARRQVQLPRVTVPKLPLPLIFAHGSPLLVVHAASVMSRRVTFRRKSAELWALLKAATWMT